MRVVFGSVKYLFKNIWYVLPFAILPALFLTLSLDSTLIGIYVKGFFSGNPRLTFTDFFCVWSPFHFHSLLSAIYSMCAFISVVVCASFLFPLVEKHMRIGRRTLGGLQAGFTNAFVPVLLTSLFLLAIYELFAVILSSLLFAICAIENTIAVYILSIVVYGMCFFALFYVTVSVYLWLPCKLITGFSAYDSFRYSYRLAAVERGKLLFAFTMFMALFLAVMALTSLLSAVVQYIAAFILFVFAFLDFCIRMETTYFKADKLDREDIIHTFKEY